MIVRRFVTALRQQDWGLAVLDFLIVVAGIFVGLQADDWNQKRLEKKSEEAVIALIAADMQSEIDFLDNYSHQYVEAREGTEEIAIQLLSLPDVDLDRFAASIDKSTQGWYWFEFDAAYRNLQQSGNISIIGNRKLAAAIVNYYEGHGAYFSMLAEDAMEAGRGYEKALRSVLLMYPRDEPDKLSYSKPRIEDLEVLASDKPFWASTSYALGRYRTSVRVAGERQQLARDIIDQMKDHLRRAR